MKAILIDSYNKEVREVEIDESTGYLRQMYNLIKCDTVTIGCEISESHEIYVDDNGLLSISESTPFFTCKGAHQPFAGNGLVMATDDDGQSMSVTISLDEVRGLIQFHTLSEVYNKLMRLGVV